MKFWTRLAIFFVALLLAAQLVPVARSNPPVEEEVPAPREVREILRHACYDCHSNEVVWPWYSRLAPASWLVARDVLEGREAVNFSTWNHYGAEERNELLEESWEEAAEGEMPPWIYLPAHPRARLSTADLAALRSWARVATGGERHEDHDDD